MNISIKFEIPLILIIILILGFSTVNGQSFTDTKQIVKSFKVKTTTKIEVYNKYGKIQVIQWDKDSVKFNIMLVAKSDDAKDAQNLLNNVDFDFTNTSYYVSAKTKIGADRKGILSDIKLLKENLISNDNKVKIDYTLFVPSYVNLKLYNKYGDVYVDDIKGDFELELSNGDFKANDLTGSSEIELKFCNNVDINSMTSGRMNISYSEVNIKVAKQINLSSKSSKVVIDKIDVLKIQSRSDKYYVAKATHFFGDTYFTDITLNYLEKELSITTKYGNLNIESISKTFSFVNVNSKITDMNLFFEYGSAYQLDITHKDNIINYPKNLANLTKQTLDENEEKYLTYGTIGQNASGAKVKIEGEKSVISIFHKTH